MKRTFWWNSIENSGVLTKEERDILRGKAFEFYARLRKQLKAMKVKIRGISEETLRIGTLQDILIKRYDCSLSSFLRYLEINTAIGRGDFCVKLTAEDIFSYFLEEIEKRGINEKDIFVTLLISRSHYYKLKRGIGETISLCIVISFALFLRMELSDFVYNCEERKMEKLNLA